MLVVFLVGLSAPCGQARSLAPSFEGSLGRGALPEVLKKYGGVYHLPVHKRLWVDEVFSRLVSVAQRDDLEYTLIVLDSLELNAFALPGGYVLITRGLVHAIGEDESKLAAVLGHEIAHVELKHGVNAVFRQMGLTVLVEVGMMALEVASADLLRMAGATLLQLLNLGWGREAEYEADLYGQALAIKAGFDGAGAVGVLDDFFLSSSEDLPMKVFRTHPDSIKRRDRLAANMVSFWATPVPIGDRDLLERLDAGRNSKQDERKSDPKDRYAVRIDQNQTGLEVFHQDEGRTVATERWLENARAKDFSWSPLGQYLAVLVDDDSQEQLWICDRRGQVVRIITLPGKRVTDLSWSPEEKQLAINVAGPNGPEVLVTYAKADVLFSIGGEFSGDVSLWLDSGLYLAQGHTWYHTWGPQVTPVKIPSPVPRVLQRQRILSPQVIKEGNTIRLTRPSLTIP